MFKKVLFTIMIAAISQFSFAGKVVVFDHEQAIFNTKLAKKRIEELQAKPDYAQMMAQAESLKADLAALSKEANSKGMTWSAEEKADHRKKLEYIQADLKLAAQKLQAEQGVVLKAIMEEIQPKLEDVLKKYVTAEDVDMILRKQVTYVAVPAVDITDKITKELDKAK
ncbi:hypothetical protein TDB9533_04051 [Thalassocella blandensis]|nr:hypothetical protein TDB9533_04051 [Thalassocella blandensis]